MSLFFRLLGEEEKGAALAEAVRSVAAGKSDARVFDVAPESFAQVPGAPFAYWVSEGVRGVFRRLPLFENQGRTVKQGLATADDFRFVRTAWEVPSAGGRGEVASTTTSTQRWWPFAKGGAFAAFYAHVHLAMNWQYDGAEDKEYICQRYPYLNGKWEWVAKNTEWYLRPGLTWPRRTTSALALRAMPGGCIFADKGPAAFVEDDEPQALLALLALTNSRAFRALVSLQLAAADAAARSYEVGVIQRTPVPELSSDAKHQLAGLARRAWSLKRSLDTAEATSHAFFLPALLQAEGGTLAERAAARVERVAEIGAALSQIQAEIDERCFEFYGFAAEDRAAVLRAIGAGTAAGEAEAEAAVGGDGQAREGGAGTAREAEDEDTGGPTSAVGTPELVAGLFDWLAGVAFGRFDVRLATGERVPPPEPEPFDPLPACSPGMLTGDAGLPLDRPPAGYPLPFPEDGVLVDDAGHPRDLAAAVRAGLEVALGAGAEEAWQEASAVLRAEPRAWLARGLFEHHLRAHSKSRRRAPIYWQLATPSASYSVWLYAHRLGPDTFFRVLGDFVSPKVQHEERRLTALVQSAGPSPTASQRQEVAEQEALVAELRAFRDEVARIAPLWRQDLDDGVIINFAPLWRLVPQHRAWQKECRDCWDGLVAGGYDWAHLAMHLWPDRVIQECARDRSLAIAHGLEDVFWEEDEDGRRVARAVDAATLERLVAGRTSAAVKDALASLLSAPAPASGRGSGRRTPPRAASLAPRRRPDPATPSPGAVSSGAAADPVDATILAQVKAAIAAVPGGAGKAEVLAAAALPEGRWTTVISALLATGEVVRVGERRGARYFLAGQGPNPRSTQ